MKGELNGNELDSLRTQLERTNLVISSFKMRLATRGYDIQIDDLKNSLAAAQAREAKLRDVIKDVLWDEDGWANSAREALATPPGDKEALREICLRVANAAWDVRVEQIESIVDELLK
jgi:hypothetical protein